MTLEKLNRLIDAVDASADRQQRIDTLISLADSFKPVPADIAQPPYDQRHRVPNCESDVYVWVYSDEGAAKLEMAVINPQGISAKALAAILKRTLDGVPLADLAQLKADIVERIFTEELTAAKNIGLRGMVALIQSQASALLKSEL